MAAKKQHAGNTKKRKRIPGSNAETSHDESPVKAPKLAASKKPFKSVKTDARAKDKKKAPVTGRERRLHAKVQSVINLL